MFNKKLHKILSFGLVALIVSLFCYFRLKPLYFQTVAFTYDQGRDFLKAAEIVLYKNPTFIGPTTGISGLYHGAWWYYYLTLPFILFKGLPIGFYYANFLIHLVSAGILFFFLKKHVNNLIAFTILFLITISPYFISTTVFVGNNIMVLPSMLFFLISSFYLLETTVTGKKLAGILFLNGLMLGFIAEFEFAFGLLIIPSFLIISLIHNKVRRYIWNLKNFPFFFAGVGLAFLPRLLFELKNNFQQTKILISFITEPKLYNPKPYNEIFIDRLKMFQGFFTFIFPNTMVFWIFLATILLGIFFLFKKNILFKHALGFYSLLIFFLFIFSTFYKDNFWGNYYEGIQYLFLFILVILLANIKKLSFISRDRVNYFLLGILLVTGINMFVSGLKSKPAYDGLGVQQDIVQYVLDNQQNKQNYCVRIYTPPVIPHTYNYLFTYHHLKEKINTPSGDWTENQCWFIIEADNFKERRQKWLDSNLPEKGKKIKEKQFKDVVIQLWSTK